jgi:hypothetical protein
VDHKPCPVRPAFGSAGEQRLRAGVHDLSGLGEDSLPVRWGPGRTGRSTDRWSHACTVTTPGGTPVLAAEAIIWVSFSSLAVIAELRVEDPAAWEAMLAARDPDPGPAKTRLELDEVQDILAATWEAVTIDLPAALDPDPALGPYSAPPAVELRLAANIPGMCLRHPAADSTPPRVSSNFLAASSADWSASAPRTPIAHGADPKPEAGHPAGEWRGPFSCPVTRIVLVISGRFRTPDVAGVAWCRQDPYAGGLGVRGVAASPSGPDVNWRMARGAGLALRMTARLGTGLAGSGRE